MSAVTARCERVDRFSKETPCRNALYGRRALREGVPKMKVATNRREQYFRSRPPVTFRVVEIEPFTVGGASFPRYWRIERSDEGHGRTVNVAFRTREHAESWLRRMEG